MWYSCIRKDVSDVLLTIAAAHPLLLQNWLARSSAAGSGGGGGEAENSLLKAWAAYGGALVPPWYYAVRGRFTDVTACHDSVCQLTVRAAARLELSPIHKRFPTVSCVYSAESLPSYFIQTLIQMNFMEGNLLNKTKWTGCAGTAISSHGAQPFAEFEFVHDR